MENLVNVLNDLIVKYKMAEEDIGAIQEALAMLENGGDDEFGYEDEAPAKEQE